MRGHKSMRNGRRTGALLFISLVMAIGASSKAQAQFYFDETFAPVYTQDNNSILGSGGSLDSNPAPKRTTTGIDSRTTLGYVFWDRMLVGLTYNLYSTKTSQPSEGTTESVDITTTKNQWGPTLGYLINGWRFAFTYYLSGTRSIVDKRVASDGSMNSDYDLTQTLASGYQLAIGYSFKILPQLDIGPSLVYRTLSYGKEKKTNRLDDTLSYDSSFTTNSIETDLSPYLTVTLRF